MEIFTYPFMQRALLAALFTGLAAPAVGTYLVQRRLALMGDGIGHVAVTGVALGLLTGTSPTWTAVVVAILGAVLIEVIRERGHANGDVALALLFYGGLAGGLLLTGLGRPERGRASRSTSSASITTMLRDRRARSRWRWPRWSSSWASASPRSCSRSPRTRSSPGSPGLNVRVYNVLVAVLAAVSVTVAMRTVGLLLVSALMVVPVATSQQLTRSFRATLGAAMVLGMVASVGGLALSALAPSGRRVAPGPDHRPAGARRLRAHLAAWAPGCGSANGCASRSPPATPTGTRPPRTSTPTSTAPTAATSPSPTRTTSTTSTTAIGTHPTGSTMTSTEPTPPSLSGARPTRQRRAVAEALASFADFRSAQEIHDLLGRRGEAVGLATVYRTLQKLAEAGEVDMLRVGGRRGDLPALLGHPPPPPRLPRLRRHRRGRGAGRRAVDPGDGRRARVRRRQPHAGDLRHLPGLRLTLHRQPFAPPRVCRGVDPTVTARQGAPGVEPPDFDALFVAHARRITRLAALLGAADPEDLAQEAFCRLLPGPRAARRARRSGRWPT